MRLEHVPHLDIARRFVETPKDVTKTLNARPTAETLAVDSGGAKQCQCPIPTFGTSTIRLRQRGTSHASSATYGR
jgi:hypothetical protein